MDIHQSWQAVRETWLWRRYIGPLAGTVSRIAARAGDNNVALVSGGVAFYAFLSVFPSIACALMVWGVFTTETELRSYLDVLQGVVPDSAYKLISNQMVRIAESQSAESLRQMGWPKPPSPIRRAPGRLRRPLRAHPYRR